MRLRLQELQEADSEAQELRQQKANGYKEINEAIGKFFFLDQGNQGGSDPPIP